VILRHRQLGLVGTTYRRVGQAGLAAYSLADPADLLRLKKCAGLDELVHLSTCNRVEWVFTCRANLSIARCRTAIFDFFHPPDQAGRPVNSQGCATALHAYAGEGAAEHLFEVAASVDSMVPGEAQILGQVKAALRQARQLGLCGSHLQLVFDEAFAAAKRVRHQTRLGSSTVSVLSLAKETLEGCLQPPSRLAIVGVGDLAEQCGLLFAGRPGVELLFINRTLEPAVDLANRFSGTAGSLTDFLAAPPPVQAILSATAAPTPFMDEAFFRRLQRQPSPPWIIDLAVSRDADPLAAARHQIPLMDLDRLGEMAGRGQQQRQEEVAAARLLLAQSLVGYRRRLADREVALLVRELREQMEQAVQQELTASGMVDGPKTDRLKASLVARLSHGPTVGLKQVAFAHGLDVVDTFMRAALQKRTSEP
jgi:glutamyl-tRNA reductase